MRDEDGMLPDASSLVFSPKLFFFDVKQDYYTSLTRHDKHEVALPVDGSKSVARPSPFGPNPPRVSSSIVIRREAFDEPFNRTRKTFQQVTHLTSGAPRHVPVNLSHHADHRATATSDIALCLHRTSILPCRHCAADLRKISQMEVSISVCPHIYPNTRLGSYLLFPEQTC